MACTLTMDFEWDQAKSEACLRERGFDFAYAAQAFFDPHRRLRPDTRREYGEDRFQLTQLRRRPRVRAGLHPAGAGLSHHLGPQGQPT